MEHRLTDFLFKSLIDTCCKIKDEYESRPLKDNEFFSSAFRYYFSI